uniref:Uncharacterized protein n=1 Tax=Mycobacterium sp. (strain KMS) TaxID=189918 RepID=A1UIV3_MYCSK
MEGCAELAASKNLTPAERVARSRHAAHLSWARTEDRTARSEPGRRAADARFEKQVDPSGVLTPAERAKRAASARAAFYADIQRRSLAARRRRAERNGDAR